jgi:PAS domain S-box-containing protein
MRIGEVVIMNTLRPETGTRHRLDSFVFTDGFLETLAEGVLLVDRDGLIVDCNKAAAGMLGVTESDAVGHSLFDPMVDPVNIDGSPMDANSHPVMMTLRTSNACQNVVVGVRMANGPRRWLMHNTSAIYSETQIEGVFCTLSDFSLRILEEQYLRLLTEVNSFVMFPSDGVHPLQHLCDALVDDHYYALAWIGESAADDDGNLEVAFSAGFTDYPYSGMVSSLESKENGRGPVGTAFRTGVVQLVNDLNVEALNEQMRERAAQFGLGSCLAIPFYPGGRRAVLALYTRQTYSTSPSRLKGLEDIAREVEFGISHMDSVDRLAMALDGTLNALSQMTEFRDPYTAGHQLHVGSLGAAIATQLGLESRLIQVVRQSGEVHDIGKIAVPSEILTKPGRLSPLEFEMVKRHTLVGYDILSKASLPWPIAEVALRHHERLDGSGYPNGLLGSEIILPVRIIAVADVVEAMTQHRPYRPGLGIDKALAEVTEGAGIRFDADVVKACLAVFEAGFTFEAGPRIA